jgi:hypothetical protein
MGGGSNGNIHVTERVGMRPHHSVYQPETSVIPQAR